MGSSSISAVTSDDLTAVRERVAARLDGSRSLEEAAQRFARELHASFEDSVSLARVYATVPYAELPVPDQQFLQRTARSTLATLRDETLILSLLGSRGAQASWNQRQTSRGHLAIPLRDARSVEEIPMIARLLSELGVDTQLLEASQAVIARKLIGGLNGLFYVPDAQTSLDARGRRIIPAQDFVTIHGIKTVFGMGGIYFQGTIVAAILFTREDVPRHIAERFAMLITPLKKATERLVESRRIYG